MSYFDYKWANLIDTTKKVVIFDVGAYNFDDSIKFKTQIPNSDVYAFEAYKVNVERYGQSAKNHGVKIYEIAVSDKNGETVFYNSTNLKGADWTCSGSVLKPTYKTHPGLQYNDNGLVVKQTRLDTFCEENEIDNVDIIHMDVQGAEYYAVKGFGDKIRPKLLFCETCEYESYENSLTQKDLDNLLSEMGYEIKERLTYDTLYVLKDNKLNNNG